MVFLAYRPHDYFRPYETDPWDSTEVDSDSSLPVPELLVKEGKRRGTFLRESPPTTDELEDRDILYNIILRASGADRASSPEPLSLPPAESAFPPPPLPHTLPSSSSTPLSDVHPPQPATSQPPLPLPTIPLPASPGPSGDTLLGLGAPRRDSKRAREEETEPPCSASDGHLHSKRPKRLVLHAISNAQTIGSEESSSAPHPPPVVQAAQHPAPGSLHVPGSIPVVAPPMQRRRTVKDLQQAIEGKKRPLTDKSHICQIGGCTKPFLCDNLQEAREHIKNHYTAATGSPSLSCLRPGCSEVCAKLDTALRHFEGHLPWVFPCPNAVHGCPKLSFSRADSQIRHMATCEYSE